MIMEAQSPIENRQDEEGSGQAPTYLDIGRVLFLNPQAQPSPARPTQW